MPLIVVIIVLAVAAVLYTIHISTKLVIESFRRDWLPCDEIAEFEVEAVKFSSADGTSLCGDFFNVGGDHDLAVVIAHGRGGNRMQGQKYAPMFLREGVSVFTFDFRGYGESDGRHTTVAWKEQDDLLAAVRWIRDTKKFSRIVVLGVSMGGAVSILAAARESGISGVISDSAFARFDEAIGNMACRYGLTPALAHLAVIGMRLRLGVRCEKIAPEEEIDKLAPRPILLIHGSEDTLIPVGDADRLYARARDPKEIHILKGLDHGRGIWDEPDEFEKIVMGFMKHHFDLNNSNDE
jgi:alpha-beta hydrolase superfamily lysophospholipase